MINMKTGEKSDRIANEEFIHANDTFPILFTAII